MFKHVGFKIKICAYVLVLLGVLRGVHVGVRWYGAYVLTHEEDILRCVVYIIGCAFAGFLAAYFVALILYGFGELVDSNMNIQEKLEECVEKDSAKQISE